MKLAVRKEPGSITGSGFHYMLHPFKLSDFEIETFKLMGHIIIIDVPDDQVEYLLEEARISLQHQCEIAIMTEAVERGIK